ncbi:hypothetical protein B0H11DRAFT_1253484 [Mycena galericulata]|nr:hypothetical protein B0H11DRAFT_1253484 [Mycena galericulata]
MDGEVPHQDNFTSSSFESGSNAAQYAGAFFPYAQNLTITGGTFTSHVTHAAPTIPRDFRMIPLGDLDLLHEIRLGDKSSMVVRKRSERKLYHVRLDGRTSKMTAAVYHEREGDEEWRRELQTYSGIRVVQIYGAVNSSALSATIFHDELIPLSQYYDLYKYSPLMYMYLKYCKNLEFVDAFNYLWTHSGVIMKRNFYTPWIRRSTPLMSCEAAKREHSSPPSVIHRILPVPASMSS